MSKLYKNIENKLHYWQTWEKDDKTGIVHWGIVGELGEHKDVKSGLLSNFRKTIQKEFDQKLNEGYTEIDENEQSFLEIEFVIDGFGTDDDLEKRHKLEEHLDELLAWTGLGNVDGGSIGSGTMEIGCVVVDYEIAKNIIEENLKNTEFKDYSRIFKLD